MLDLFMFPLRSTNIGSFFFLPELGSFHLVPFFPFVGCLLLLMIGTFENMVIFVSKAQVLCLKKCIFTRNTTIFFGMINLFVG